VIPSSRPLAVATNLATARSGVTHWTQRRPTRSTAVTHTPELSSAASTQYAPGGSESDS